MTGDRLKRELDNPILGQEAIVEGLIFKDTINLFYSDPGAGKSVIAVNMLASMSGGWPVFGMFPMKRFARCSYLQLEGSKDEQLGRLKEMIDEIPIDHQNIAWHTCPLSVESNQSQQQIFKELHEYKPEVIFIDSFYCLTSRGLSKEEGFLPVRQLIKQIKDKTGATIIILHHSQKPQYHDGKVLEKDDPFLGSQYLRAFVDMMIHCKRQGENKVILKVTKASRNNEGIKQIALDFDKLNWTVKANEGETTQSAIFTISIFLKKEFSKTNELTSNEIAKATGFTKRHIRRLKSDHHFDNLCYFKELEGKQTIWIKKDGQKSG